MDVLASAAVLEAMDISAENSGGMAAGAADGNAEHADMVKAAANLSNHGKRAGLVAPMVVTGLFTLYKRVSL